EERRVHRHVHEGVDPAPPADLESPEGAEGTAHPRDIAAFLRQRAGQLGHGKRDGQAPHERRQDEEQEGEPGPERRDGVLDAVGTAANVEEDDGEQRNEAELPAEPGAAHRACASWIIAGKPFSQSSMGTSASTRISSLPEGMRRTRPVPVASGITTCSRCTPMASSTAKILLI